MRCLALLILIAACSGPMPEGTYDEHPVFRPPGNAPPDPIGPDRPNGARSCNIDTDCRMREHCWAPDATPAATGAPMCLNDSQCGSQQFCVGGECRNHCKPADCTGGLVCGASGRCGPPPCNA